MTSKFSSIIGHLPKGTSDPSSPSVGDEYYDTGNNRWMRWDGVQWRGLAFTTSTSTSTTTTTTSTSTTTTSSSTSTTTTSTSTSTSTSTTTSTSSSTSTTV